MARTIHAQVPAEVATVADLIAATDAIALDTEFLWERTYRPQLCLLQVAGEGFEAIIDPLAVTDLRRVWEAIVGGPTVVVHAGAHDLDIILTAAGKLPATVFDTQIAGAFLGYGDAAGYGNLVGAVLGHPVRGGEGYTDWSRRPLSSDQVKYALEDVRHLLDMWRTLTAKLEERGRTSWVADETQRRLAGIGETIEPPEAWRRVADARKLKGRALAVLRSAAEWREREAIARDQARQRLVPDRVLIEVARRAPTDPAQISDLRGLHPGQAKLVAAPLAEAVRRAIAVPEGEWPRWPQARPFGGDSRVDAIASLLHGVVRSRAVDMELSPGLLGTRGDLEELARMLLAGELDREEGVPLLTGWRRTAAGNEVLRVLRGQAAVRVTSGPGGPHLEVG